MDLYICIITLGDREITDLNTHATQLVAFLTIESMCGCHDILSDTRTPRSFSLLISGNSIPSKKYLFLGLLVPACITLHLLSFVLNFNNQMFCHSERWSKSVCRVFFMQDLPYIFRSSAKRETEFIIEVGKSFMYKRKSNGPKTEPCGIPDPTGKSSDDAFPTLTLNVRPDRKSEIVSSILLFIPKDFSFTNNL